MIYNYCIYSITNKINGKIYIGKTKADTKRRWADHIRDSKSNNKQYLHNAIAKYGVDNFEFKTIKFFENEQDAYKAEISYIKKYNSFGQGGYNETLGGEGQVGSNNKLEKSQVKSLIKDYVSSNASTVLLSEKYNLSKSSVLDILNRRSYLNIKISEHQRYMLWLKLHRNFYDDDSFGENSSFLKLNTNTIVNIFNDFATGKFSQTDMSEKYNTSIANISFILKRETHSNVKIKKSILNKVQIILNNSAYKLLGHNDKIILKNNIFNDFKSGSSKKNISEKYNISYNRVHKILNNTYWKNIELTDKSLESYVIKKTNQSSNEQAKSIIIDYCNGTSINSLTDKYNKSKWNVLALLKRNIYKNIDLGEYELICKEKVSKILRKPYSDIEIINIFTEYINSDLNITELANKFNSNRKNISNILNRKTFSKVIVPEDIINNVNIKLRENMLKDKDELTTIPNEKYRKFFAKFEEIDNLDVAEWRTAHLLGYFCKKYKEAYGVDYSWKFNNQSPSKCFEVWQLNTLCAKLSSNPKILKEYIDWAYTNLVPKAKRRLTSISFLTKDEVVNPYKMNILLGNKKNVNRSALLPDNYKSIMKELSGVDVITYGDFAFIMQMDPLPDNITLALNKMIEMGFDKTILERIV